MRWEAGLAARGCLALLGTALLSTGAQAQAPAAPPAATAAPPPVSHAAPGEEAPGVAEWLRPEPGGLTADEAAAQAVASAPAVRRAVATAAQARAAAARAKVVFVPTLRLMATYTRLSPIDRPPLNIEEVGIQISNPFPQQLDNFYFGARVTVPLSDLYFTVLPSYHAARAAARASRDQLSASKLAVALRARKAFYEYVRARATRAVASQAIALVQAHQSELRALIAAHAAAPLQMARADSRLADAQLSEARATGQLDVTEMTLQRILHSSSTAPIRIAEDVTRIDRSAPPSVAHVVAVAMRDRADVRALEGRVQAREAALDATAGQRLPHVALDAHAEYSDPNARVLPQVHAFRGSWDASVIVSWSPNDYVVNTHATDEARQQLVQAREDLNELKDQIAIQAARAVARVRASVAAVDAATASQRAARRAYDAQVSLLHAGAGTSRDVLDAQAELVQAELALVSAYVDCHLARANLEFVTGTERHR